MRLPLTETQMRLPLPAPTRWPEGAWDIQAFAHGSMSTILFTPRGNDYQSSHEQDELYIVVKGGGVLMVAGDRHPITAETREFYKKVGFVPIETYPRLWGAELPILQFIKVL